MNRFSALATALALTVTWLAMSVPYGKDLAGPPIAGTVDGGIDWPARDDDGCGDGRDRPCSGFFPPIFWGHAESLAANVADAAVVRVRAIDRRIVRRGGADTMTRVRLLEVLHHRDWFHSSTFYVRQQDVGACDGTKVCNAEEPLRPGAEYVLFLTPAPGSPTFWVWHFPQFRIDSGVVRLPEMPAIPASVMAFLHSTGHTLQDLPGYVQTAVRQYVGRPADVLLADVRRLAKQGR